MSSAFGNMKKSRMGFDQLAKKFESDKQGGGSNQKDERLFYPQLDENKNGQAVIRFLPPSEGEESPWVKIYSHGFKGPSGQWYIEECPTTVNQECPVCAANSVLWNSGIESDKTIVRERKRRMQYIANVLVVEDKKNPEREGKVMLFKFGAKIFDKLKTAMYPEFDGEVALNPFDFWEGANFKLRIRKVDGNVNYDKSEFADTTPVAKTDKAIETIWADQYKLSEFLDTTSDRFKSFEALEKQLARALGLRASTSTAAQESAAATEAEEAPENAPVNEAPKTQTAMPAQGESDDAMDFFRKMADAG